MIGVMCENAREIHAKTKPDGDAGIMALIQYKDVVLPV